MFATVKAMTSPTLRWRLADQSGPQVPLFVADATPGRRVVTGAEYLHVRASRVISTVPTASRLPFSHTINVYRGCAHACVYCFARPTHQYLGLDAERDFEQRIVVKINAVERLRAELRDPAWCGASIAMGTNTDPYQPAEGRYRLTRGVIEALIDARNPFSILTKSTMIMRDADLLTRAVAEGLDIAVNVSIGTLDRDVWHETEPGTPPPHRRMDVVRRLNESGVPCGVLMAPVLPLLSDAPHQLDAVVAAAVEAGAPSIAPILLHLRPGVREIFMTWLAKRHPGLVPAYAEIYARPSGYAPRERSQALSITVGRLIDAYRGYAPIAELGRPRGTSGRSGTPVAPVRPAFAQISLPLSA